MLRRDDFLSAGLAAEQVWSLAVNSDETRLVTGSAAPSLRLYRVNSPAGSTTTTVMSTEDETSEEVLSASALDAELRLMTSLLDHGAGYLELYG